MRKAFVVTSGGRVEGPAAEPNAAGCGCGCTNRKPEPFDRERTVRFARKLDQEAENAGTDEARKIWESRAELAWNAVELHDQAEARMASAAIGVVWNARPIVAASWEDSVLKD